MRKQHSNNIIREYEYSLINEDNFLCLDSNVYYLRVIDGEERYLSEDSMCNDEY